MYDKGRRDWVFESYAYGNPFRQDDVERLVKAVGVPLPRGKAEGLKELSPGGKIVPAQVSRKMALWQRLNNALAYAGLVKRRNDKLSPHELRDAFHAVLSAAAELKRALRVSSIPAPNEWDLIDREIWEPLMRAYIADRKEPGAFRAVLDSLLQLEKWAARAKDEAAASIRPGEKKRNKGNIELVALFGSLAGTWLAIWNDVPRRTADHPFPKFCQLVLAHAGITLKKRQLRHLLSRVALPSS